jgi:drug/metabolite transporter (DMT)-like permease
MSSVFKITLRHIEYDLLLLWSSLFGILTLFIIDRLSKNPIDFRRINRKQYLNSALMGLFNPFLYYLVLFKAYELLEAQIAGTLNYTWPVTLVIMSSIFLHQKINLRSYFAILVSFAGIVVISTNGKFSSFGHSDTFGVILAVGSSIIWASYWILNLKDKRDEIPKILLNLIFGFVFISLYILFTGKEIIFPTGYALYGSIYIGLFEMSITFVIWLMALKYSENTAKVSNLIFLSPFIALIFISITVGETIRIATLIGLVLIISGILIQRFFSEKKKIRN